MGSSLSLGLQQETAVARSGGRAAAVAVDHSRGRKAPARAVRNATPAQQPRTGVAAQPEPAVAPARPVPAFHERSLFAENLGAAFRIEAGGGWATGTLPFGSGENEVAKFMGEAISLTNQMQAVMGGAGSAVIEFLIADPEAGPSRQSALKVSVEPAGGTVVTMQPGGGGHLVAMLQHFLMALNPAPR